MSSSSSSNKLQKKSGKPQPVSLPTPKVPLVLQYPLSAPQGRFRLAFNLDVTLYLLVPLKSFHLLILEKLSVTTPSLCIKSQGDFHT